MINFDIETNFVVSLNDCAFSILLFEAISSIDESPFSWVNISDVHIDLHVLGILLESETISVKFQ
jgi:hypothetical protein